MTGNALSCKASRESHSLAATVPHDQCRALRHYPARRWRGVFSSAPRDAIPYNRGLVHRADFPFQFRQL